jgi:heat shock protein HslJ
LAALVSVTLPGCNAGKNTTAPQTPHLAGTEWNLEDLGGKPVLANARATLDFPRSGGVKGNGSCNRFTGAATMRGDSIRLGPKAATKMMCDPDTSNQEAEYFKALDGARRFALKEGKLLLFADGSDELLRFRPAQPGEDR